MKKRINFIKVFIMASIISLVCTACVGTDKEIEVPDNSISSTQASEVNISTKSTEIATQSTENPEIEEIKIVEAIHNQVWSHSDRVTYDNSTDKVDELTNRYLGNITSEEDAIEKGKFALEEMGYGYDDNRSYEAKFNDEYDVWVVKATLPPPYIDADGTHYATIGTVPYIVIRQSDGKALGTFVG